MSKLKMVKLGDVLDVKRGASLSGEFYSETGTYKRLTLGNFTYPQSGWKENLSKDDIYFIGPFKQEFLLHKGDIITPLTEQVRGLLGNTAFIPEDNVYIQSGDIGLIIPNEELLDKTFAYYLVSSPGVKKQLDGKSQQTKIRHTSPDAIKDCVAYIPPLDEQKKIGKVLFAIDENIKNNTALSATLEETAKTLYDYWFTQFDFPNEEGKPYRSSGGKMVWNEELKREIPEGWKVGVLSDIADITMGQSPEGSTYNDLGNGTIFFQGCTDFGEYFPKVRMYTTNPTRFAKIKDILVSVRAPVGTLNIANTDCCIGRGLAALSSKQESSMYLYNVLIGFDSKFKQMNSVGTTFGALTKDMLFNLPVVYNEKTIEKFKVITESMMNKLLSIGKENNELCTLRDYLLPLLMNGQVTIED